MIQPLLDEIYHDDLADDPHRDQAIREKLRIFSAPFAELLESPNLNYDDAAMRFAYLYRFVTGHAKLVAERFAQVPELTTLFQTPERAFIACLGAGPGSEVLGLLQAASRISNIALPEMHVTLLDNHPVWAESWSPSFSEAQPPFAFSTTYIPWDVLNDPFSRHKFFRSDWFTMVYFLSDIYAQRDRAIPALTRLFQHAKPGARIFYLDHSNPPCTEWMITLAQAHGFSSTQRGSFHRRIVLSDEDTSDLGVYLERFGTPQWSDDFVWGILTKSDPISEAILL